MDCVSVPIGLSAFAKALDFYAKQAPTVRVEIACALVQ